MNLKNGGRGAGRRRRSALPFPLLTALLGLSLFFGQNGTAAQSASALRARAENWRVLDKGLYYRAVSLQRESSHWRGLMHQLKFDLALWKPVLCQSSEFGKKAASVREVREYKGAAAAVNACFFDENGRTLGYLQQNGREIDPYIYPSGGLLTGVFEVYKQKAIVWYRDNFQPVSCELALQAGPRLVDEGEGLSGLRGERERLSGLAVCKSGEVVFYNNEYTIPLTLAECRDILMSPPEEGGVNPRYVLNLDGGRSAAISIRTDGFSLERLGVRDVPAFLTVKKR